MGDAPAAVRKPCCVCAEPGGQQCTKCKSRHYCSKACQLVDWYEGGHKAQCKQLAAAFQDRLLDELMPEKLKIKEEPPIVADVAPAPGSMTAARLPAARATAKAKATAPNDDAQAWRAICAICLDRLPVEGDKQTFHSCCCKSICTSCNIKCRQHDERCPLCRAPAWKLEAEWLRRIQKHVDKGHAEAQFVLGGAYCEGSTGLEQNFKKAFKLFQASAAQGNAPAQNALGGCYELGEGVQINSETAALWFRRAAEQGFPAAQCHLGQAFYQGKGVAQSVGEALQWFRLAAAQGYPEALYNLGACHGNGQGVPKDLDEALRCFKRAAATGHAEAATAVESLSARLRVRRG